MDHGYPDTGQVQHLDAFGFGSALVVASNRVFIWKSLDQHSNSRSDNFIDGIWSTYDLFTVDVDSNISTILSLDSVCVNKNFDFPVWKFSFATSDEQVNEHCWSTACTVDLFIKICFVLWNRLLFNKTTPEIDLILKLSKLPRGSVDDC